MLDKLIIMVLKYPERSARIFIVSTITWVVSMLLFSKVAFYSFILFVGILAILALYSGFSALYGELVSILYSIKYKRYKKDLEDKSIPL